MGSWDCDARAREELGSHQMSGENVCQGGDLKRYDRQMRFAPLGEEGQRRLAAGRALVLWLRRAGFGDRGELSCGPASASCGSSIATFVELNNLQRQFLFDEARRGRTAAQGRWRRPNKLRRINSAIEIEPVVADVDAHEHCQAGCRRRCDRRRDRQFRDAVSGQRFCREARQALGLRRLHRRRRAVDDDPARRHRLPGAACMPEPPPPGSTPTCDTAGILGSVDRRDRLASKRARRSRFLSGNADAISRSLTRSSSCGTIACGRSTFRSSASESDCRVCQHGEFRLAQRRAERRTGRALWAKRGANCGTGRHGVSLEDLAMRLAGVGESCGIRFCLRLSVDGYQLTVFPDGRTIVGGTDDVALARTLQAKYVGS